MTFSFRWRNLASRPAGRDAVLLGGLAAASLACFAEKAFHIDDPFYLRVAQHVLREPADFFGLTINWYGTEELLAAVNQNPPGVSYFMALAALGVGWSERGLHLAFVVPAVCAVLGTYFVAARLSSRPLAAAAIAFATPVFFVSSTTLMSDVLMLAFFTWAVYFWLRGLERRKHLDLALAGLLAAAAALTKYFAIALLPLLFVYSLARERKLGVWAAWLALPAALLGIYELYAEVRYGHGLIVRAVSYAVSFEESRASGVASRALSGMVFAGGCLLPLLFHAPFSLGRRGLAAAAVAVLVVGGALLAYGELGAHPLRSAEGIHWGPSLHALFFGLGAVWVLALVAGDLFRQRDAESLLLALWVLGTLAFAVLVNWTTNARAVLPAVPAAAILLVRWWDRVETAGEGVRRRELRPARWAPVAAGFGLSLLVAWGDAALADSARRAARAIAEHTAPRSGTLWFEGHWGFQHYMEERGARPVDYKRSRLLPGDIVAIPLENTNLMPLPPASIAVEEELRIPVTAPVATMSRRLGAGFYTSLWGPFPYAFGSAEPQVYRLAGIGGPVQFR